MKYKSDESLPSEEPANDGGCFPIGTLVGTLDGARPIETVQMNERLWAYDLVTGEWRPCRVIQTLTREYRKHSVLVTAAGETVEATTLHPFWVVRGEGLEGRPRRPGLASPPPQATTPGRWVDAQDLRIGDELLLRGNRVALVEAVGVGPFHEAVYNFLVAELQCYSVGDAGFLVHNGNGKTDPDVIAEEMGPGHFRDHGDPSNWEYLGKKEVPASGRGFEPGTKKVYEVYLDENGNQIEWHYWKNADGTTEGGKLVFPGSTRV